MLVLINVPNACISETNLIYMMEPKPAIDRSQVPTTIDYTWSGSVGQEIRNNHKFTTAIQETHHILANDAIKQTDIEQPGQNIIVITLDTGSVLPSKCHNGNKQYYINPK
jgi:hypothetical protein